MSFRHFHGVLALLSPLLLIVCKTAQPAGLVAQEPQAEPSSLLWKIEGDQIQTSYLFGTIHLIEEDEYFFTQNMQSAFDSAEGLALEFNLEDAMNFGAQLSMLGQAFMKGDTTLRDLLTDAEYQKVEAHFNKMGVPFMFFERIKPMFLTIFASEDMFSGDGMTMNGIKSYELELVDMAKARNMQLEGLETMEYQLSIFDSIPYGAQADMLVATIEADEDLTEESMDSLIYYYKAQDLDKLDELINADQTTAKYRTLLLDNRNKNWIPVMIKLMQEKPMFIAVGAGHLAGEQGVIQLLKDAGFVVTPILQDRDTD